jgi:hypothetical protein
VRRGGGTERHDWGSAVLRAAPSALLSDEGARESTDLVLRRREAASKDGSRSPPFRNARVPVRDSICEDWQNGRAYARGNHVLERGGNPTANNMHSSALVMRDE